jgi:hypothetical protein
VKRQIVEASLKAFGVPTDRIIQAALGEIGALDGFVHAGETDAQKILAEGKERIARLEQEIAQVKRVMDEAVAAQSGRARAAEGEKLRVGQVLDFFGPEAVAAVTAQMNKDAAPAAPKKGKGR